MRPREIELLFICEISPYTLLKRKLGDVQSCHLAEMETVDCQGDSQWEQSRTPEQSPEKELPVLDAFSSTNTQLINGPAQSQDVLWLKLDSDFRRLIFAEEC